MIRAGIIGCGNIAWQWDRPGSGVALTHARAYDRNPRVQLVACADQQPARAQELARAYPGVTAYDDYQAMLKKEKLDVVSVCTTTSAHYDVLRYLLENTDIAYILGEKPLTENSVQTREIARRAKEKKVSISVNYIRRWDESINAARQALQENMCGQFLNGSFLYYGGFKNNGIHFLDVIDFFGIPLPDTITHWKMLPYKAGDIAGSFCCENRDGASFSFRHIDSTTYLPLEIDFLYERGRVRIADQLVELFCAMPSKAFPDTNELTLVHQWPATLGMAMQHSIDHIVDLCEAGEVALEAPDREIQLMELIEKLYAFR